VFPAFPEGTTGPTRIRWSRQGEDAMLSRLHQFLAEYSSRHDGGDALYQHLFENHRSVMLIIDPRSGAIVDANASACVYYGYQKDAVLRMKIFDINTLTQEQICREMECAVLEQRNYFNFKHRLADDSVRDVEVYCSPVRLSGRDFLFSIIHDITDRLRLERERDEIIAKLEKATQEIKTLRGILPVCCFCKKIRDDQGEWEDLDSYVLRHSEAKVSHGLCPACRARHYPGY